MPIDLLCLLLPYPRKVELKKKILIIRLDGAGDFILWLDAAKGFRKLFPFPQYKLTLLGNSEWYSLARGMSFFDEVLPLERRKFIINPIYRFNMLKKIRRANYKKVIQPTFSRKFMFEDSIVRVSGAEERIGINSDFSRIQKWQKRISDQWYTNIVHTKKGLLFELERNAEFIRKLGLAEFRAGIPELHILGNLQVKINSEDYYVLFPGARYKERQWPLSYFKELDRRLYKLTGWVGIICGGPGEELLGEVLEQNLDIPLHNLVGRTSLQELISIIANANILVGNETCAIHISSAVSTPSVCILGGGHFGRFMPYQLEDVTDKPLPIAVYHKMNCFNCNWQCKYNVFNKRAFPCISQISVNDVWKDVEKLLETQYGLIDES